jgi:membrane-associated protease RseP (regulator of RpoE activity)
MTAVAYTLGVLLFLFGVAVSIGLHELGHLIPGKLFDVKVTQYFVGFGRTVWSRRRGETEYGLKAVPLGGYVKLVGMLPPEPDAAPRTARGSNTGMFAQLMSDARSAEYELVEEGDEERLFYRLPWWKRIVIMGSGVATNLVIAFLLFAVVFMGHGVPTASTTVEQVSQCVIAVTKANLDQPQRACTARDQQSPAKAAGIRPGDRIVSFNGTPISGWNDLQKEIRGNSDGRAVIGVVRGDKHLTLRTNTTVSSRADPNDPATVSSVGFLGVGPTTVNQRQGLGYVVSTMSTSTWDTLKVLGSLPVKIYHVGRASIGLEKRDQNGPMSVVGAGRVAGELTSQKSTPISDRFFSVLLLLAGLNLFLGLFNLVPLPPLDGGPIAATLYETGRRRVAKLLRRPDPGFVDSAKLLPVTYVMAALILVVSVVLIYADIVVPVKVQ